MLYETKRDTVLHRWRDAPKGDYGTVTANSPLDGAPNGDWIILDYDPLGMDNKPPYCVSSGDVQEITAPPAGDTITIPIGKLQIDAIMKDGTIKHFQSDVEIIVPESYG